MFSEKGRNLHTATALVWGLFCIAFFMNKESQEYNFWTNPKKKEKTKYSIGEFSPHQDEIIAFMRDALFARGGGGGDPVIADFGTFTGRNVPGLKEILKGATTVIGTDIKAAEEELKSAQLKGAIIMETEFDSIAFKNQSIDGALCWRVLHNLSTLDKIQVALAEMHRVLKDNSPCVISVRSATNIGGDVLSGAPVRATTPLPNDGERTDWYFTKPSLTELMEQAGFKVVKMEEIQEGERISGKEEAHTYLTCYAIKF